MQASINSIDLLKFCHHSQINNIWSILNKGSQLNTLERLALEVFQNYLETDVQPRVLNLHNDERASFFQLHAVTKAALEKQEAVFISNRTEDDLYASEDDNNDDLYGDPANGNGPDRVDFIIPLMSSSARDREVANLINSIRVLQQRAPMQVIGRFSPSGLHVNNGSDGNGIVGIDRAAFIVPITASTARAREMANIINSISMVRDLQQQRDREYGELIIANANEVAELYLLQEQHRKGFGRG